jgi:hypothetical protein
MLPTDIWFLRCRGSEMRKSASLPECPRIALPRNSPLGDYVIAEYRRAEEHDPETEPPWPFDYVCLTCGRVTNYSSAYKIDKLEVPRTQKEYETEKEYERLIQWLDSKRFWRLETTAGRNAERYQPSRIYTIAAKDISHDDLKQAVYRIAPVFENIKKEDVSFSEYDFLGPHSG